MVGYHYDYQESIMNSTSYDKLLISIRYWLLGKAESDPSYYQPLKALEFALEYHDGVRKDNTTKEFYHQLSMVAYARTVVSMVSHPALLLTVILLHDTYEDYEESHQRLASEFPEAYAYIVRISKVRDGHTISYEQYFGEMSNCNVTSVAKAIDRIHNLSTMNGVFSEEKKRQYLDDVQAWFLPMIKVARKRFPEQEPAYEQLKSTLILVHDAIDFYVK